MILCGDGSDHVHPQYTMLPLCRQIHNGRQACVDRRLASDHYQNFKGRSRYGMTVILPRPLAPISARYWSDFVPRLRLWIASLSGPDKYRKPRVMDSFRPSQVSVCTPDSNERRVPKGLRFMTSVLSSAGVWYVWIDLIRITLSPRPERQSRRVTQRACVHILLSAYVRVCDLVVGRRLRDLESMKISIY